MCTLSAHPTRAARLRTRMRPDVPSAYPCWLRTHGVSSHGAAANVMNFGRLGKRYAQFIEFDRLVPQKYLCQKSEICSDPIGADPSCPLPTLARLRVQDGTGLLEELEPMVLAAPTLLSRPRLRCSSGCDSRLPLWSPLAYPPLPGGGRRRSAVGCAVAPLCLCVCLCPS